MTLGADPRGTQEEKEMLVLSRMEGEKFMIGDSIEVTVVWIDEYRVKIGIEAPRDVEVWRAEIYYANQRKRLREAKEDIGE